MPKCTALCELLQYCTLFEILILEHYISNTNTIHALTSKCRPMPSPGILNGNLHLRFKDFHVMSLHIVPSKLMDFMYFETTCVSCIIWLSMIMMIGSVRYRKHALNYHNSLQMTRNNLRRKGLPCVLCVIRTYDYGRPTTCICEQSQVCTEKKMAEVSLRTIVIT